jgi:hypothetical protein
MTTTCLFLALLVGGCRRGGHSLAPVSGRVTLQGKPMAKVNVAFQPLAAPGSGGDAGIGSYGVTDSDGRFQLKTVDGKPGAVVGKHTVYLTISNPNPPKGDEQVLGPPSPFPPRAWNGSHTFEVPAAGTDQAHLDF